MSRSKNAEAITTLEVVIRKTKEDYYLSPNSHRALSSQLILEQAKLNWKTLYRKEDVRPLLAEYAKEKGLAYSRKGRVAPTQEIVGVLESDPTDMVPQKKLKDVQQRVSELEKKIADLRVSNTSLRADACSVTAHQGQRCAGSELCKI